jgi:D-beta-D-heptose 7-phosphate kinase/D-beta-D-heptose 1-phosphate adenosyltransferase
MKTELPDFSRCRVLVAGDVMLDRYWSGDTGRISPEAPVPVVRVEEAEERVGGAGNVAANVAALGAGVTLFALAGEDPEAARIEELLQQRGCAVRLERLAGQRTVTKLRVLSRHQQLLRLDFEQPYPPSASAGLAAACREAVAQHDLVVLSDYAKGTLADPGAFIDAARAAGRPVVVDPKRTDFAAYRGATVVTPNQAELRAVVGAWRDEDHLEEKARRLLEEQDFGALLVTRSEQGMTLVPRAGAAVHLAAEAREVFDVTGAGDTVVAVLGVALAAGMETQQAAELANTAGGIVVGKLGTATTNRRELIAARMSRVPETTGMVGESVLLELVARAREAGERMVMTNGCFDILHPGHVAYLEQAAALGDRLVVAVNDDASVTRLKGSGRPVNPLAQRMAVLAGLRSVDWVVPFSEDTPERLVCAVAPDYLVKGGDYRPDDIAGARCVREAGGEVVVLDFVEGFSTTAIIQSLGRGLAD